MKNVHTGENMLVLRSEPHDSAQVLRFHKHWLLSFAFSSLCCYKCTEDGTCGASVSGKRAQVCRLNLKYCISTLSTLNGEGDIAGCRSSLTFGPLSEPACVPFLSLHLSFALHSCRGRAACADTPAFSVHTAWINSGQT